MAAHGPVFKLKLCETFIASTIDLMCLSSWDKVFPLTPRIYVNTSALLDAGKEVLRRAILGFESMFVENSKGEMIQKQGTTDKEMCAHDR